MKNINSWFKPFTRIIILIVLSLVLGFIYYAPNEVAADIFTTGECLDSCDASYTPCHSNCLPNDNQCHSNCGFNYSQCIFGCPTNSPSNHRNYNMCRTSSARAFSACINRQAYAECLNSDGTVNDNCCRQTESDEFQSCYYP